MVPPIAYKGFSKSLTRTNKHILDKIRKYMSTENNCAASSGPPEILKVVGTVVFFVDFQGTTLSDPVKSYSFL